MSKSQKFHHGDLVRVSERIPLHFRGASCQAIVIASYHEQFGGKIHNDYTLYIQGVGECSWYTADTLTLIESGREDLLKEWQSAAEKEAELKGDLDWIFQHGQEVLLCAHGSSIATLAFCVGIESLWGNHGEGISYYTNAMRVLSLAHPFLVKNNKEGWLKFCESAPKIKTIDYEIH